MRFKASLLLLAIILLAACKGNQTNKGNDTIQIAAKNIKDPVKNQKEIDEQMALGDRPDSEQETPSQMEEKKRLESTYDKTQSIDTIIKVDKKNYRLILNYYCLRDSVIIVPATYDLEDHPPRKWKTHPFAASVWLLNEQDTIFKKSFTAVDFYPFFKDNFGGNLKSFGSILMPEVSHNRENNLKVNYSISIPATDIGIGMSLIVKTNGNYKIIEN
jgi:hypothetical protein